MTSSRRPSSPMHPYPTCHYPASPISTKYWILHSVESHWRHYNRHAYIVLNLNYIQCVRGHESTSTKDPIRQLIPPYHVNHTTTLSSQDLEERKSAPQRKLDMLVRVNENPRQKNDTEDSDSSTGTETELNPYDRAVEDLETAILRNKFHGHRGIEKKSTCVLL